MEERIKSFEQKVVSAEKQIKEGKELTEEQYKELGSIALSLINDKSERVENLHKSIIRVKNWHHTIRNINYIKKLEAEYDISEKEFLNPSTSEERKKELVYDLNAISEILYILR